MIVDIGARTGRVKDASTARGQAISLGSALKTRRAETSLDNTTETAAEIVTKGTIETETTIEREVTAIDIIEARGIGTIGTIEIGVKMITEEEGLPHALGHTVGSAIIGAITAHNLGQEAMTVGATVRATAGTTMRETTEIGTGIGMSLEEEDPTRALGLDDMD